MGPGDPKPSLAASAGASATDPSLGYKIQPPGSRWSLRQPHPPNTSWLSSTLPRPGFLLRLCLQESVLAPGILYFTYCWIGFASFLDFFFFLRLYPCTKLSPSSCIPSLSGSIIWLAHVGFTKEIKYRLLESSPLPVPRGASPPGLFASCRGSWLAQTAEWPLLLSDPQQRGGVSGSLGNWAGSLRGALDTGSQSPGAHSCSGLGHTHFSGSFRAPS